jgi:hypothetical protein
MAGKVHILYVTAERLDHYLCCPLVSLMIPMATKPTNMCKRKGKKVGNIFEFLRIKDKEMI